MAHITFLGATGTVTGSRHLLELDNQRILIDCGLFQGKKENRLKNWEDFPVDPGTIDKIFITHAHIDHSGYLPRLFKNGFNGPIYCTTATADLLEIMLKDSAHLQEEDAKYANRKGYSKHSPALPLYTMDDALNTLSLLSPVGYGEEVNLNSTYRVKFKDAGHILGSSFVDIKNVKTGKKILFSGDLGRPARPVLRDPVQVYNVDFLVLESTYGDRLHGEENSEEELARIINESIKRQGVLVIPAFAVGRTQMLLYMIREMEEKGIIPSVPIFVDSPMAIDTTRIFKSHIRELNLLNRRLTLEHKKIFHPRKLRIMRTRDESKHINDTKSGAIIISASGMATGGRILHHLDNRLREERNTILFIGYQAEGTRGRAILEGAEEIKIHGQYVPVKAKIESLTGFSGHADYEEILAWLMGFNKNPEQIFIVHGEADASASMAAKIREEFGWNVHVPTFGETVEFDL